MIGIVAALEHAYGFYPRENVLDSALTLDRTISRLHVGSTGRQSEKRAGCPDAWAVRRGPASPIVFVPLSTAGPEKQLPPLEKPVKRGRQRTSFRVVASRHRRWRCRARLWIPWLSFWIRVGRR